MFLGNGFLLTGFILLAIRCHACRLQGYNPILVFLAIDPDTGPTVDGVFFHHLIDHQVTLPVVDISGLLFDPAPPMVCKSFGYGLESILIGSLIPALTPFVTIPHHYLVAVMLIVVTVLIN